MKLFQNKTSGLDVTSVNQPGNNIPQELTDLIESTFSAAANSVNVVYFTKNCALPESRACTDGELEYMKLCEENREKDNHASQVTSRFAVGGFFITFLGIAGLCAFGKN